MNRYQSPVASQSLLPHCSLATGQITGDWSNHWRLVKSLATGQITGDWSKLKSSPTPPFSTNN